MDIENAKQLIIEAVDKGLIPGATFGCLQNGEESLFSYGFKEIVPQKIENDIDTLYDLASLTKVVSTTTMILKMIEEGSLSLETRVKDILDDFPYEEICIAHLLCHTSGLPADDKRYRSASSNEEMYRFIKSLKLDNAPGTFVEYSDFGFILLGMIIDEMKGSLENYADATIFRPLSMDDTMYNPYLKGRAMDCAASEITEARGLIRGVVHDGKAHILGGLSGNAGLFSNVGDLLKFARTFIDGEHRLLDEGSIEMLKRSQTAGLNLNRTLGWQVADSTCSCGECYSDCAIYHTGFSGTSIYIDFARKAAIVLLTNRVHPSRDNSSILTIRNSFHDALLKR